jgi:hypothetical protein
MEQKSKEARPKQQNKNKRRNKQNNKSFTTPFNPLP